MAQTYGIEQTATVPRQAIVLEEYDSRFKDYENKGYLLFIRTGTLVGGALTVNVEAKAGATVYVFPMTPVTVTTVNNKLTATYDVADYPPASTENVLVAVLIHQSDINIVA